MSQTHIDNYSEFKFLLSTVSAVINGTQPPVISKELNQKTLYSLACESKLSIFLFTSIMDNKNKKTEQWLFEKSYFSFIEAVSKKNNHEQTLESLRKICEENCIPNIPLKGSFLRGYYPAPELRYMTDVDLLIHPQDEEKLSALLIENGYKMRSEGNIDDEYITPFNSLLELHRKLLPDGYSLTQYFKNVWEKAKLKEKCSYTYCMDEAQLYTYLIVHCLRHFCSGGISTRMVLDLYIFRQNFNDEKLNRKIEDTLKNMGIKEFADKLLGISYKWFSQNGKGLEETVLEKYIIENKNMGQLKNIVLAKAASMELDGVKATKASYIIRKIFPPYSELSLQYERLLKKPYLYPYYYLCYIAGRLKQALTGKKAFKTMNTINKLDSNREAIEEMKKIIEELKVEEFIK